MPNSPEYWAEYYAKNRLKIKARQAKWYKRNRARLIAKASEYHRKKQAAKRAARESAEAVQTSLRQLPDKANKRRPRNTAKKQRAKRVSGK